MSIRGWKVVYGLTLSREAEKSNIFHKDLCEIFKDTLVDFFKHFQALKGDAFILLVDGAVLDSDLHDRDREMSEESAIRRPSGAVHLRSRSRHLCDGLADPSQECFILGEIGVGDSLGRKLIPDPEPLESRTQLRKECIGSLFRSDTSIESDLKDRRSRVHSDIGGLDTIDGDGGGRHHPYRFIVGLHEGGELSSHEHIREIRPRSRIDVGGMAGISEELDPASDPSSPPDLDGVSGDHVSSRLGPDDAIERVIRELHEQRDSVSLHLLIAGDEKAESILIFEFRSGDQRNRESGEHVCASSSEELAVHDGSDIRRSVPEVPVSHDIPMRHESHMLALASDFQEIVGDSVGISRIHGVDLGDFPSERGEECFHIGIVPVDVVRWSRQ